MGLDFDLRKKSFTQGFTLIELVIVFGILAIIGAFILVTIDPLAQFQKTNDAKRKSDLSQIQKALEAYYQDVGSYPSSDDADPAKQYFIHTIDAGDPVKEWGTSWMPYMATLPKDPNDPSKKYLYVTTGTNPQSYYLYASLDRGSKDPQVCSSIPCPNVPSGVFCGSSNECSYGVSSPNVSP